MGNIQQICSKQYNTITFYYTDKAKQTNHSIRHGWSSEDNAALFPFTARSKGHRMSPDSIERRPKQYQIQLHKPRKMEQKLPQRIEQKHSIVRVPGVAMRETGSLQRCLQHFQYTRLNMQNANLYAKWDHYIHYVIYRYGFVRAFNNQICS